MTNKNKQREWRGYKYEDLRQEFKGIFAPNARLESDRPIPIWRWFERKLEKALAQKQEEVLGRVENTLEELKAEKVSVLNGKIRTDIRKDSKLHNDYGEKLCWNGALEEAINQLKNE